MAKSKSTMHSVIGTARWAKLFERNRDRGEYFKETDGITSVELILDQDTLKEFKDTGSRVRPKVTEEGITVKLRRPWVHRSVAAFGGAPKVVDAEDNPWDEGTSIGNDSRLEVFFTTYETPMGLGTRLEGVRVLELVEYVSPDDGTGDKRLPF